MHRYFIILFSVLSLFTSQAQGLFDKQLPKHIYPESIVDSVYGITMYENLVAALGGDSIRKNGTYACQGWFEDAYENGKTLHKGYYTDGQLMSYKNYYPDGKLEREFNSVDALLGEAKIYYDSGNLKSHVKYNGGTPAKWTDYFESGKMQYEEKMNRGMDYYEYQRYYFEWGSPQKLVELTDKKKLEFSVIEYYANGVVKIKGMKIFLKDSNSYYDHGEWKTYDESGALIKTEKFDKGVKL